MQLVYPIILHKHCFQFLLGITVVPKGIEDNGYAKFWGVNKLHYRLCETGELQKKQDISVKMLSLTVGSDLGRHPG